MLRACAVAWCLAGAGCSFALVRPAPPDHAQRDSVDCTAKRAAPIVDVVGAATMGTIAVAAETFSNLPGGHSGERGVTAQGRAVEVAAIGLAVVHVLSAAHGFHTTAECRRAKDLLRVRLAERTRAARGCASDLDCKGGRLCVQDACRWPAALPDGHGATLRP